MSTNGEQRNKTKCRQYNTEEPCQKTAEQKKDLKMSPRMKWLIQRQTKHLVKLLPQIRVKMFFTDTSVKKRTKIKKRKHKHDKLRPEKEQTFSTKENPLSYIEAKESYENKSTAEMDSIVVGKTLQEVSDTVAGVKHKETSRENKPFKVSKKRKKEKKTSSN